MDFEISEKGRKGNGLDRDEFLENVQLSSTRPAANSMQRTQNVAVTKSLSREEIARCPEVQEVIRKEAEGLIKPRTWDEDSRCEEQDLIDWALKHDFHITISDLLILGSIKFFERAKQY